MAGRKTHLDVVTLSIGGNDQLTDLLDVEVTIDHSEEDARSVTTRHRESELVKSSLVMVGRFMQTDSGVRQSNLNVSTVTFAGGGFAVADVRSGSLRITTNEIEGSGDADQWMFPCATGTEFEGEITMLVADDATGTAFGVALGAPSGLKGNLTLAIGQFNLVVPVLLKTVKKRVERQGAIEITCNVIQDGAPVTCTGDVLLVNIFTGSATAAYAFDDSIESISGNALLSEATLEWSDASLLIRNVTLKNQGTPTIDGGE